MSISGIAFCQAVEPLHPGSGESKGAIDNCVQREVHTQWPIAGLKGAMRSSFRQYIVDKDKAISLADADVHPETVSLFGAAHDNAGDHDGALIIPTARILAFPVRSAKGLYILATCPQAINEFVTKTFAIAGFPNLKSGLYPAVDDDCVQFLGNGSDFCLNLNNMDRAQLEEIQVIAEPVADQGKEFAEWMAAKSILDARLQNRLAVVSDDVFTYFTKHCTMIMQRNKLDPTFKKVVDTALFVEEFLPPDTVLYSPITTKPACDQSAYCKWNDMLEHFDNLIQFGADSSTGKGWSWMRVLDGGCSEEAES